MHDELTPAEREAFAALPRERRPGHMLEQRIVYRLRRNGVLGHARGLGIRMSSGWLTGAVAASVLVGLGFVLGQWMGSRHATRAAIALQQENGRNVSAMVQATGSAYVGALEALAETLVRDPESGRQGTEVALSILRAASRRVVSLAPDEPLAFRIIAALEGGITSAPRDSISGTIFEWF